MISYDTQYLELIELKLHVTIFSLYIHLLHIKITPVSLGLP